MTLGYRIGIDAQKDSPLKLRIHQGDINMVLTFFFKINNKTKNTQLSEVLFG